MGCAVFFLTGSGSAYQKWKNYPDSPLSSMDYPYQLIVEVAGYTTLGMFSEPISVYAVGDNSYGIGCQEVGALAAQYRLADGVWVYLNNDISVGIASEYSSLGTQTKETNQNIYYGEILVKEATTAPASGGECMVRIRNARHINALSAKDKCAKVKFSEGWGRVNI